MIKLKKGTFVIKAIEFYLISVYLGMNISGANDLTCYYDNSYERFTLS
jgi:hypothetical protein